MIPTVIIVGADKGGVGKTTITRALLDYLADRQVAARTFDTEWPSGDLKRFAPDADLIDIANVQDQMKVFDMPDASPVTVVDLRAGLLSPTLQALDDAKLLEDVRSKQMRLVLLHVLGPTMASIAEIAEAAKRVGGGAAHHLLVRNHINQTQFFDWDKDESQAAWQKMANVTIEVPQLPEIAAETLQKLGGSFAAFSKRRDQSRVLPGRVQTWLEAVWREFDRVGLNQLLLG
jgi:MinD-like ATPase involved in chromosome partitioning or flagellar assembly